MAAEIVPKFTSRGLTTTRLHLVLSLSILAADEIIWQQGQRKPDRWELIKWKAEDDAFMTHRGRLLPKDETVSLTGRLNFIHRFASFTVNSDKFKPREKQHSQCLKSQTMHYILNIFTTVHVTYRATRVNGNPTTCARPSNH